MKHWCERQGYFVGEVYEQMPDDVFMGNGGLLIIKLPVERI